MTTREDFYDRITKVEPLTGDDIDAMIGLSKSTAFIKFLNKLLQESDAKASTLLVTDLTTQLGINNAIKQQGVAHGLSLAVELFTDYLVDHKAISTEPKEQNNDN